MFTGLVQGVGHIVRVDALPGSQNGGVRLTIDAADIPEFHVRVGDSIAVAGACMTAIRIDGSTFSVDTSAESLARTAGLDREGEVNLETSMRLGDQLGGHLLSGHVDGVGEVVKVTPVHESWQLAVLVPNQLSAYLAYKGSVAINGVSLTVNRITDGARSCEFDVNIIPHTYRITTLRSVHAGDRVNIEVDLIARYVERMLSLKQRNA
ncbi:MAG: riboflavin synthase [Burkholderiaceae bacterium]